MRYLGAIDSDEINKAYEKSIKRLMGLSIKLDAYEEKSKVSSLCTSVEISSMRSYINQLLEEKESNLITANNIAPVSGCYKNILHGYLTRDVLKSNEKLKISDILPSDLFVDAYDDKTYAFTDINVEGITTSSPYIREIKTSTGTSEIVSTIIVAIPMSINTDTLINFIEFDVFPFNLANVIAVESSPVYDDRYFSPIEALTNHSGCTVNKYNLNGSGHGHIALAFSKRDIKKIAITIKRPSPSTDTSEGKIFHVGISNLSIRSVTYKNDPMMVDCTYNHGEVNGVFVNGLLPVHSGIMETPYNISVYKKVGSSLVKLMDKFRPFKTGHEPIVFRISYNKTKNPIVLKELKVILK